MSEILASLTIAILVGWGIYAILEGRETFRAARDISRVPVAGPEALVGCKAKVHSPFEPSKDSRRLSGRVLIDGESWNAELDRPMDDAPEIGTELVVIAVDPSKLKVSVK